MKKTISILLILAALMCMLFVGCGDSSAASSGSAASNGSSAPAKEYVFSYNGISIPMKAEAAPIVSQLGEPLNYFESESCAFKGLDKVYTYASFELSTYPVDGVDYVLSVRFTNDTVSTPEGISIGSSLDSLNAAYSASVAVGETGFTLTGGDSSLAFILDGSTGAVTSVKYSANN